jgi:hypothetical protein
MGHSSAVRLRYVTFHSLREMTPENLMGHSDDVRLIANGVSSLTDGCIKVI